jgi:hypothetical protein
MAPIENNAVALVGLLGVELGADKMRPQRVAKPRPIDMERRAGEYRGWMEAKIVAHHHRQPDFLGLRHQDRGGLQVITYWLFDKDRLLPLNTLGKIFQMVFGWRRYDDGVTFIENLVPFVGFGVGQRWIVVERLMPERDDVADVTLADAASAQNPDLHY